MKLKCVGECDEILLINELILLKVAVNVAKLVLYSSIFAIAHRNGIRKSLDGISRN